MSRPRTEAAIGLMLAAFLLASSLMPMSIARAHERESAEAAPVPCAVVTGFDGELEILDVTRTHLLKVEKSAAVPCGGWLSTTHGSVELKHRDGHRIHLAENTFAQVPEPNPDGHATGDQVVLFRGQLYVHAGGGNGELRVATANARARVSRGSAIVVFSQSEEETQLIALENSSQLENRFEITRKVKVKPGEASSLNFKLLRVVPSAPRAVSLAGLHPKFEALHVPARERSVAMESAHDREERTLPSALVKDDPNQVDFHTPQAPQHELKKENRGIASVPAGKTVHDYAPHEIPESAREKIRDQMVNRLVAGESSGMKLLGARKPAPKNKVHVQVQIENHGTEDADKRKLIDELSQIREDN